MTSSETAVDKSCPGPGAQAQPATVGSLFTVGVVSDTHGQVHAGVRRALTGVNHIIHAGDVGSWAVIEELGALAPLTAVRGNCDYEPRVSALPAAVEFELAGVDFSVTHVGRHAKPSEADTSATKPRVVITGHTHQPALEWREGVLFLNPGAAGPRRFGRGRTVALLRIWGVSSSATPAGGGSGEQGSGGSESGGGLRLEAEIVSAEE